MNKNIKNLFPITSKGHYLASASISGLHKEVEKAHHEWLEFYGQSAGMNDGRYFEVLQQARTDVANYLGAQEREVSFVCNSSYAFNIMAMMLKQKTSKRKVLIPQSEFPTTYLPWHYQGWEVIAIPEHGNGNGNRISLESILDQIECDDQIAAVACSSVLSFSGQRLPIKELAERLKKKSVYLFVNSTQEAGAFPIEWQAPGVTGQCFSCHKRFGAGMGTSVFLLKEEFFQDLSWPLMGWTSVQDPWEMTNVGTKMRMEMSALELGSLSFNNIVGISKSIEIQSSIGLNTISEHIIKLTEICLEKLKKIPVEILTPHQSSQELSGIISFRHKHLPAQELAQILKDKNIFVNQRQDFLRVSFHIYNTEQDIVALLQVLTERN